MIASAWLAYSCAVFVLLCFFMELLGRRVLGVVGWHYHAAYVVAQWAALGFAVLACLALFLHLVS